MGAISLANARFWMPAVPEHGVSVLGLPTERSAKRQLPESAEDLLRTISTLLEAQISSAIEKRTAADFQAARQAAFGEYVELVLSFSKVARAVVKPSVLDRLASESFCELE